MSRIPSPYFTDEHELFRQSVRDFIEKEVVPNAEHWEKDQRVPRSVYHRMGELGFLGINFPEAYGGTDNDFFYTVAYLEELARCTMGGFAANVSVHQYMSTAHLSMAGSESLKQRYLPGAISGEKWGALGVTEPFGGSDVASMRTTAVRDGDHYIINGSKTFITNGVYGDFVALACKTTPDAGIGGISLIVVDQGTPGFTATKLEKMGWHTSDTAEMAFNDVRVPVSNLIGRENEGFFYIMESFQLERLVAAIMAVEGASHCLEITLKYMQERQAFGRSVNRFQALRHRVTQLYAEIDAVRQQVYHTAFLYSKGVMCVKECTIAKMLSTELGKKVADECVQFHGGYGYMESYTVTRMYRDARVATIVGGTTEIMHEILGKIVIDGVQYESTYAQERSAKSKERTSTPTQQPITNQTSTETPKTNQKMAETAKDLIHALPQKLRKDKAAGLSGVFHFELEGDTGGQFTVSLANGECTVQDGLQGTATCVIKAKAKDYEDVLTGRANAQMAVMMGKIKISNLGEMMKFMGAFSHSLG